ncbi:MAG: fumarylacetoacetase, partial [Proteobacteria bacterium]|nr:fumarylacetoacetase [Pseudomonadota bacterium]
MTLLDPTHDPAARSWLAAANAAGCDFPIQNLPFAVLRKRGSGEAFRGAVAIGDQALDLAALHRLKLLAGAAADALHLATQPALNDFMAAGPQAWRALRHALFALLAEGAAQQDAVRA